MPPYPAPRAEVDWQGVPRREIIAVILSDMAPFWSLCRARMLAASMLLVSKAVKQRTDEKCPLAGLAYHGLDFVDQIWVDHLLQQAYDLERSRSSAWLRQFLFYAQGDSIQPQGTSTKALILRRVTRMASTRFHRGSTHGPYCKSRAGDFPSDPIVVREPARLKSLVSYRLNHQSGVVLHVHHQLVDTNPVVARDHTFIEQHCRTGTLAAKPIVQTLRPNEAANQRWERYASDWYDPVTNSFLTETTVSPPLIYDYLKAGYRPEARPVPVLHAIRRAALTRLAGV